MNAEEASALAVERGGARYSVCPVCNEHFLDDWATPLAVLEATLREHCEAHTAEEYLTVIAGLKGEAETMNRRLQSYVLAAAHVGSGIELSLEGQPFTDADMQRAVAILTPYRRV